VARVYHVTTAGAAAKILANGFEDRSLWVFADGRGYVRGTFFCGFPAHDLPGAPTTAGGAVIALDILETELPPYFIEDQNPAPMWIVSAAVANRYTRSLA
jgi:hypothetical protein